MFQKEWSHCLKNKIACNHSEKCDKKNEHDGDCNEMKKAPNKFWLTSPSYKKQKLIATVNNFESEKIYLDMTILQEIKTKLDETKTFLDADIIHLNEEYQRLKSLIDPKSHSKTKREKNTTNEDMISNTSNSTQYYCRKETKDILEYLHGGKEGAIFGTWAFLCHQASSTLENKKGKWIENLHGSFSNNYQNSDQAMHQAVATKYNLYLSRLKFRNQHLTVVCKSGIQNASHMESKIYYYVKNYHYHIGSISCWNFGRRIRSREYHYPCIQ